MGDKLLSPGDAWKGTFAMHGTAGASLADALPTCYVVRNNSIDTGVSVTVAQNTASQFGGTNSNVYTFSATVPTNYAALDFLDMLAIGAVGGVTDRATVDSLRLVGGQFVAGGGNGGFFDIITKGTTNRNIEIDLRDSATGNLKSGVGSNAVTIVYQREGAATYMPVTIVPGLLGTFNNPGAGGGWVETLATGIYQFGPPNAALASGANAVTFKITAAGVIDRTIRIMLSGVDLQNTNSAGIGNLDAAVSTRATQAQIATVDSAALAADLTDPLATAVAAAIQGETGIF